MKKILALFIFLTILTSLAFVSAVAPSTGPSGGGSVAGINHIKNSGFEDSDDHWDTGCWWHTTCDQEIDNTYAYEGDYSAKLTAWKPTASNPFAASSGFTDYMIDLKPDTTYKLTAWVYMEDDASITDFYPRTMVVMYKNESDWLNNIYANPATQHLTRFSSVVFPEVKADEWTYVENEFTTNDEHLIARAWIMAIDDDQGICLPAVVWFDEVELREVKEKDGDDSDGKKMRVWDKCEPDWDCSGWSTCAEGGGPRTRTCEDINQCEYAYDKPAEIAGCELPAITEESKVDEPNYLMWVLIALAILLILILIILAIRG